MSRTAKPITLQQDLFCNIAAGNTRAFEEFVDQYSFAVLRFVTHFTATKDGIAVMGITIDIFLDIWKQRDHFAVESRPSAFLYRVVLLHLQRYLKAQDDQHRARLLQAMHPRRRYVRQAVKQGMRHGKPVRRFTSPVCAGSKANRLKGFACLPVIRPAA